MAEVSGLGIAVEGIRFSAEAMRAPGLSLGQALTHFSSLTMRVGQMRNMARVEYKQRTGNSAGKRWPYEPWKVPHGDAKILELMHELRVDDFHAAPFQIGLQEEAIFEPLPGTRMKLGEIGYGKGAFQATNPEAVFRDASSGAIMTMPSSTPGERDRVVPKVEQRMRLVVLPGTDRVKRLMDEIQIDDALELSERTLSAAEAYVAWLDAEVGGPAS